MNKLEKMIKNYEEYQNQEKFEIREENKELFFDLSIIEDEFIIGHNDGRIGQVVMKLNQLENLYLFLKNILQEDNEKNKEIKEK
ncbi:MAG: hypothetical protein ACTSQG_00105 [Promethearchaeota archaeon]